MKLQPTTRQEVQGKRDTYLNGKMASISMVVVDCGKPIDERL